MQQVFLSVDARQRDNWREAFPDLMSGRLDEIPDVAGSDPALLWALLPAGQSAEALVIRLRKSLAGRSLVLLADEPSENDAMAALAAGAAGYCNGHAAPQVLLQVAMAVENGGVWVGQGLMQRLLAATSRLRAEPGPENSAWRRSLTAREQEAAVLLARGASNKEIARQLDITERTVKSHVSAMLEKLGVRDRLQLALIINGIEKQR
jgi:DNA-binding NarL/FixJ family response regulator